MNDMTKRERDCIALVAEGYCDKAIARALGIQVGTVKTYLAMAYRRLGFRVPGRTPRVLAALWVTRQ